MVLTIDEAKEFVRRASDDTGKSTWFKWSSTEKMADDYSPGPAHTILKAAVHAAVRGRLPANSIRDAFVAVAKTATDTDGALKECLETISATFSDDEARALLAIESVQ